jgi:hypothetical protein
MQFSLMVLVWSVLGSLSWLGWATVRSGWQHLRRLHQVPCDRCAFATGDYHLKCAVHPCRAFTEQSLGCLDFERRCSDRRVYPVPKWVLKR